MGGLNKEEILRTAKDAAKAAGLYLVSRMKEGRPITVTPKGRLDYVTEADQESERIIREIIQARYPDHSFLAEEGGLTKRDEAMRWVVDPLDGTVNYMSGFPFFCVSIGFMNRGVVEVGVIYEPVRDELFEAVLGCGARLNGRPIKVNNATDPAMSIVSTGFPHRIRDVFEAYLVSLRGIYDISAGVRRVGSAALDLCYTAAGRTDGFWEPKLSVWDIAAGSLIAAEAGAVVTDFSGGKGYFTSGDILCASPGIYPVLFRIIEAAFKTV
jgi:myo-inositol-1(or 4)-monophosphatase